MSNVEVKVDEKQKVNAKGMGLQNNELISDLTTFTPQSIVPEVEVKVTPKVEMEVVESGKLTNSRFAVSLIKSITGSGCLGIPFSIMNMGIVPTIIMFAFVAWVNVINSKYLIESNDGIRKHVVPVHHSNRVISNDYGNLMFQLWGNPGYYTFLFFFFVTIWGIIIGTIIGVMDNIKNLNWPEDFLGGASSRNLIFHIILTLLIYIVSCIQDLDKLFFVSWFGIFTLLISYLAVVIYGFVSFSPKLSSSLFWFSNFQNFAKSLGIAPYSLGYNFAFLTFYKQVRHEEQPRTYRVTKQCVVGICFAYLSLASLAAVFFSADPRGVQQIIVQNLPASSWAAALIYVLVAASCLCTMPVFISTTAELLESGCPKGKMTFFVRDWRRLAIRGVQVGVLSGITYAVPFFSDICSFDIRVVAVCLFVCVCGRGVREYWISIASCFLILMWN